MPLYDFECSVCSKEVELLCSSSEKPVCEICGQEMKKLLSKFSVRMGAGIYSMDVGIPKFGDVE